MLTAIELRLQQRMLKIHPEFRQLLAELADYRLPDSSITQDSVMALGFAVANADRAHAVRTAGRESVLDLEPFTDEWYDWYADRRLRSQIDMLNDNDAPSWIAKMGRFVRPLRLPSTEPVGRASRSSPSARSSRTTSSGTQSTRSSSPLADVATARSAPRVPV
jgi:hypothetical protein